MIAAIFAAIAHALDAIARFLAVGAVWFFESLRVGTRRALGWPDDDSAAPAALDDPAQDVAVEEVSRPAPRRAWRPAPLYEIPAGVVDYATDRLCSPAGEQITPPAGWPREIREWAAALDRRELGCVISAGTMGVFRHFNGDREIAGVRQFPLPAAPRSRPAAAAQDVDYQPAYGLTPGL